jgi:hypothetical protein
MEILNREAFQEWRESPLTQDFFRLMADRKQSLMEQWAAGTPGAHSPEFQAQARLLGQLAEMNWDSLHGLFGIERKEEENDDNRD